MKLKMKCLLVAVAALLPMTCYAPKLHVTNLLPVETQCTQLAVVGWTETSFTFCVPAGKWYLERATSPAGPWTVISVVNVTTCARVTDQFDTTKPTQLFYRLRRP